MTMERLTGADRGAAGGDDHQNEAEKEQEGDAKEDAYPRAVATLGGVRRDWWLARGVRGDDGRVGRGVLRDGGKSGLRRCGSRVLAFHEARVAEGRPDAASD